MIESVNRAHGLHLLTQISPPVHGLDERNRFDISQGQFDYRYVQLSYQTIDEPVREQRRSPPVVACPSRRISDRSAVPFHGT